MAASSGNGITGRAQEIIIVSTILNVIAIIAVAIRAYARSYSRFSLGADDYVMIASLALSSGVAVTIDYMVGATRAADVSYKLSLTDEILVLKTLFAFNVCQIVAMALIKISVLLFYLRIFGISRQFTIITYTLIGVISSFSLAILLVIIFPQRSFNLQWDPFADYNVDIHAVYTSFVAGNAIFDILTLVLPIATVQTLHINQSKKLFISVLFILGGACIVVSVIRLYYSIKDSRIDDSSRESNRAAYIDVVFWGTIEPPVFITTGSMLAMAPLVRSWKPPKLWFGKLKSKIESSKPTSTSSHLAVSQDPPSLRRDTAPRNPSRASSTEIALLPL